MVIYTHTHTHKNTYKAHSTSTIVHHLNVFLCSRKHEFKSVLCNILNFHTIYDQNNTISTSARNHRTRTNIKCNTKIKKKLPSITQIMNLIDFYISVSLFFCMGMRVYLLTTTTTNTCLTHKKDSCDSKITWFITYLTWNPLLYGYSMKTVPPPIFSMNLFFISHFILRWYKFIRVLKDMGSYGNDVNVSVYCNSCTYHGAKKMWIGMEK